MPSFEIATFRRTWWITDRTTSRGTNARRNGDIDALYVDVAFEVEH